MTTPNEKRTTSASRKSSGTSGPAPLQHQEAPKQFPDPPQFPEQVPVDDKLVAYPEHLPDRWFEHLCDLLTPGFELEPTTDARFVYHVLGYALGRLDPDDVRPVGQTWIVRGLYGTADALENLTRHPDDWAVVAAVCRKLLQDCQEKAPPPKHPVLR